MATNHLVNSFGIEENPQLMLTRASQYLLKYLSP